ncbi:MAG: Uma2 family endonuclease [Blastocatellia bacterium]
MSARINSQTLRTRPVNLPEEIVEPSLRRFTVEEYYKMVEAGVLHEGEKVELIEGEIIAMSPQGTKHASSGSRTGDYLRELLGRRVIVRSQMPIHLDDMSEPEPDIVVALPDEDYYSDHHPTPPEILMVMEVSYSTLDFDRKRKSRVYANAGIRQYCLLNLQARELEDYQQPSADGYRSKQTYAESESFTLAAFPKISVKVAALLPPLKRANRLKSKSK